MVSNHYYDGRIRSAESHPNWFARPLSYIPVEGKTEVHRNKSSYNSSEVRVAAIAPHPPVSFSDFVLMMVSLGERGRRRCARSAQVRRSGGQGRHTLAVRQTGGEIAPRSRDGIALMSRSDHAEIAEIKSRRNGRAEAAPDDDLRRRISRPSLRSGGIDRGHAAKRPRVPPAGARLVVRRIGSLYY